MVRLTIVNGIIQDDAIMGVPFKRSIVIPKGASNVYTKISMSPVGQAIHNTANTSPTAGADNHAKYLQNLENADTTYLGAHFFVDAYGIVQTIPINMVCWHAGDGRGSGNMSFIAIEICENADVLKAEENAKKLVASLKYTKAELVAIKPHQSFSGKYCPRVILARKNGMDNFIKDVNRLINPTILDNIISIMPKPKPVVVNASTVHISGEIWGYKSAADALNDKNRVKVVPKGTYPIMINHPSGAWNIGKGYLYWINPAKINTVVPSTASQPKPANVTTVKIAHNVWAYKTAADAMADKNRVRLVPKATYPIMIKHKTGAWNIGKGYLFWINPKQL